MPIEDKNENLIDDSDEATIGMTEINNFDFNRAGMLMAVMEKGASVAPKCTSIFGIAQAALNEMNEEALAIARRRAAEAQAQAEADAKEKEATDDAARVPRAIPSNGTTQADVARRL